MSLLFLHHSLSSLCERIVIVLYQKLSYTFFLEWSVSDTFDCEIISLINGKYFLVSDLKTFVRDLKEQKKEIQSKMNSNTEMTYAPLRSLDDFLLSQSRLVTTSGWNIPLMMIRWCLISGSRFQNTRIWINSETE